jgi:hypothetical protein
VYLYGRNAITNFGLDACQKDQTEVSLQQMPSGSTKHTGMQLQAGAAVGMYLLGTVRLYGIPF